MKIFILMCGVVGVASAYGASPTFGNFDQTQFSTNGSRVAIKSGFQSTNAFIVGATVRHPSFADTFLFGTSDNVLPSINYYGNNGLEFHPAMNGGGMSWWIGNQVAMRFAQNSTEPILRVTELHNKTLGNTDRGAGSTVSLFIPRIGGSGSAIQDLPLHGAEIWQHQPKPVFGTRIGGGITAETMSPWTASHTNMVAVINGFQGALIPDITNYGVAMVIATDTGWMAPHRTNGLFVPDPALFPNITNSIGYAHTNGFEFWVNAYFNQGVPTVGNTEIDCNVAGHAPSIFQFPLQANPNGTNYIHPVMTPNTVRLDVDTFYGWGADGLMVQDMNPWNAIGGYEFQRSRLIGNAVVYPGTGFYWAALYDTWFDHGMALTLFVNTPHVPSLAYECNAMILDNFVTGVPENDGQNPLNTSPVSLAVAYSRAFIRLMANAPEGSVRPTYLHSFGVLPADEWGDHGYKSVLGMASVMRGNVMMQQPMDDYDTPAAVVINTNFLAVWSEMTGKPWLAVDNGNNSAWANRLPVGDVIVLMANEITDASTNITVQWNHLKLRPNVGFGVYDVWTNSYLGEFTNSYTVAVGATNSILRRFIQRPVPIP